MHKEHRDRHAENCSAERFFVEMRNLLVKRKTEHMNVWFTPFLTAEWLSESPFVAAMVTNLQFFFEKKKDLF